MSKKFRRTILAVTAVLILLIYGAYFLATYLGSRRMAAGK